MRTFWIWINDIFTSRVVFLYVIYSINLNAPEEEKKIVLKIERKNSFLLVIRPGSNNCLSIDFRYCASPTQKVSSISKKRFKSYGVRNKQTNYP